MNKDATNEPTRPIPYGKQDITAEDIQIVVDVLNSDLITQGPAVPRFEESVSRYTGARFALAMNSATSALHAACHALGVGRGDRVWTSPITFVASSNCALYCGAAVDFVDIDPVSYNMSVKALEEKLHRAKKEGSLPKVVIPVHLCGQSCPMEPIRLLSKEFGFSIIEDASHAIGGKYQNRPIGDCSYSDVTVFSFHPVKIITTAEGGMALTNDAELAETMARFRTHGITMKQDRMHTRPSDEIWNYQQIELGYNYRMTDIQAALGCSQMTRLDQYVQQRHVVADLYNRELKSLPIVLPQQHPETFSSYHLYPIRVPIGGVQPKQKTVYEKLRSNGILCNLHYIPVYLQPHYASLGFSRGLCPNAEQYFKETVSLPMYATLTPEKQMHVISVLNDFLK